MTGDKLINAQTFEFADPESGGGAPFGIDTSNVIASLRGTRSYTATEDCWVAYINMHSFEESIVETIVYVDGKAITTARVSSTVNLYTYIPLAKGQTMTTSKNFAATVYAAKQSS